MSAKQSYRAAADDPVFECGHYVEAWELQHVSELSIAVRELLRAEAARGNKVRSITKWFAELSRPLGERVSELPSGLAFCCPIQGPPIGHYDGDEHGAVLCLSTGVRVFPTGHEVEPAIPPQVQADGAA